MSRTRIKQLSMITLVGLLLVSPTFAQTADDTLRMTSQFCDFFIDILSWIWVVLAVLAGKLMTNEFIYGEFMNLDVYLWQIWNIFKNFANFALGFGFLYLVAKPFFD